MKCEDREFTITIKDRIVEGKATSNAAEPTSV